VQTLLGVLGVLFGAGQFVISLIDLGRGRPVVRTARNKHPPANLLIPERERAALQLMLVASATVALGAAAFLFAQQHYVSIPASESVYEVALASYNRQRIFAWLGIGLTAIAAVAALAAWRKWSQVPAWPREMILSVVLVVLAGLLLLALWDTPVMVRSHPSRHPFANASHHRLSTSTVSIDAASARTYHLFQTSTVRPSRLE